MVMYFEHLYIAQLVASISTEVNVHVICKIELENKVYKIEASSPLTISNLIMILTI